MNYKMIGRILSIIIAIESLFMLPGMMFNVIDGEQNSAAAFAITIAAMLVIAGIIYALCRNAESGFYASEGFVCVGISWIVMSILGCMPFFISGEIPHFIDAFFEMVSGFTTTGASILENVEVMSRGMLYWRSFSHWLGGMGMLVFIMAVVPLTGKNNGFTMHLLRAESPGPSVGKLVPRMRQTAMLLYGIYIFLTVVDFACLMIAGMPAFDAMCASFGTAGTGGFGIKADSFASYTPAMQNITTVFMLLFGTNFSIFYMIIIKKFKSVLYDEELRLYLGMFVLSTVIIAINVRGYYASAGETIRHAAFQVSTVMTTTGFATTDFDIWPSLSKAILLCIMISGACAGSTGGGIKCARVLLYFKSLVRNVKQSLHPNKVEIVRVNRTPVSEQVLKNADAYLAAYCIIVVVSFIIISIDGFSIETNISAVLACFNNIGPGFDIVGPTCNYASYSDLSKIVLSIDMLAGRLEIFPILALLSRSTWHRKI
jgi:trk system potassium uptake protein TrkH